MGIIIGDGEPPLDCVGFVSETTFLDIEHRITSANKFALTSIEQKVNGFRQNLTSQIANELSTALAQLQFYKNALQRLEGEKISAEYLEKLPNDKSKFECIRAGISAYNQRVPINWTPRIPYEDLVLGSEHINAKIRDAYDHIHSGIKCEGYEFAEDVLDIRLGLSQVTGIKQSKVVADEEHRLKLLSSTKARKEEIENSWFIRRKEQKLLDVTRAIKRYEDNRQGHPIDLTPLGIEIIRQAQECDLYLQRNDPERGDYVLNPEKCRKSFI